MVAPARVVYSMRGGGDSRGKWANDLQCARQKAGDNLMCAEKLESAEAGDQALVFVVARVV